MRIRDKAPTAAFFYLKTQTALEREKGKNKNRYDRVSVTKHILWGREKNHNARGREAQETRTICPTLLALMPRGKSPTLSEVTGSWLLQRPPMPSWADDDPKDEWFSRHICICSLWRPSSSCSDFCQKGIFASFLIHITVSHNHSALLFLIQILC